MKKDLPYQLFLLMILLVASSRTLTFGFLIQYNPKSTTTTTAAESFPTTTTSTTPSTHLTLTTALHESNNNSKEYQPITTPDPKEGIYRPFLNYAWDKLSSSGLISNVDDDDDDDNDNDNDDDNTNTRFEKKYTNKIQNSSPSKGGGVPDGTVVNVEIQSVNGMNINHHTIDNNHDGKDGSSSLRLARYAILETMTPSSSSSSYSSITTTDDKNNNDDDDDNDDDNDKRSNMISFHQGIHVLNLVLFPTIHQQNPIPLPILGMDLVTLPGGKHLIAIDFQPIHPLPHDCEEHTFLFPQQQHDDDDDDDDNHTTKTTTTTIQSKYETKIKTIHNQYVKQHPNKIIWGGDIPQPAKRFFSPYALWTRLKDEEGLDIIQNQIYIAFCAYFDLYIELLQEVQQQQQQQQQRNEDQSSNNNDCRNGIKDDDDDDDMGVDEVEKAFEKVRHGHRDYLTYRRENDPARPMLTRLYGNDWTEDVISEVLFKMI